MLRNGSTYFVSNFGVPSCIQSNFLWYTKHLLIDHRSAYLQFFADKNVNFLGSLFDGSGNFKLWNVNGKIKAEFNLVDN